jgi:hypothetical protein
MPRQFTIANLPYLRFSSTEIPVIVALIAAVITIAGWFVTKNLDRRQKRAEFRRAYIQRQIEEFYGPLYSLIWQIFSSNKLKERILMQCSLDEDEQTRVRRYFSDNYFLPLHARIKSILESKLYLVEGTSMPESIYEYLSHSLQEDTQYTLWAAHGISTIDVRGTSFPQSFYEAIESTLKQLMLEYEVNVQELKTGASAEDKLLEEKRHAERERIKAIAMDEC